LFRTQKPAELEGKFNKIPARSKNVATLHKSTFSSSSLLIMNQSTIRVAINVH